MQTSTKDFYEFHQAIKNDELVFLFGTGISSALTGKQYSWWKWIVDGIGFLQNRMVAAQLQRKLEADGSTTNMIQVVGEILQEAKRDGSYQKWMHSSFEVNQITNGDLAKVLQKLLITQDVFTTTNYDLLLEHATGLAPLSYSAPDMAFSMLDKHLSTHILHIHGIYDSVHGMDNIVADETQYNSVIGNQGAQFIQGILSTRTLIFVGCGKTTEDANISRFIQFANTHLKMDKRYYFLYNSSSPIDDLPDNIVPIPYGDEYDDLTPFLDDLATERVSSRISGNSMIGRSVFSQIQVSDDDLLKYHYAQRAIPLYGRSSEIEKLMSFVEATHNFSWWALTGQAGSGKSRLALELLYKLPVSWFGFFLNDGFTQADRDQFIPFCNTLIIIDYISGRERKVSEAMQNLMKLFEKTNYKLRILLLERENSKKDGSWYAKLMQRLTRTDSQTMSVSLYNQEFLNLGDLSNDDVLNFISCVCQSKGLDADAQRDRKLMELYGRKYEHLRFRPLFLQLFIEAWVNNDRGMPRYDSFSDILKQILQKEQEKWLAAVDNNQNVCNAFIHLLLRANISGKLNVDDLPDYYKPDGEMVKKYVASRTFPGKQRHEQRNSLINQVCQDINMDNEFIAPLFPDVLKEYMFCFYMEEDRLNDVMNEIWRHAASSFSVFIARCLMDFPEEPFYKKALNSSYPSAKDLEVLVGRLGLLQGRQIQEGEDPEVFWELIDNEYAFWHSIIVPEEYTEENDAIACAKVTGLNKVATHIGAWSLFDVSEMIYVLDEMIEVKGWEGTELIKKFLLSEQINSLATHSFKDAAMYLQGKLDGLISDTGDDFDNLMFLQGANAKMMDHILAGKMGEAYAQLEQMSAKCNYNYIESARKLAHSAFNFENFVLQTGEGDYVRKALPISYKIERQYPDDLMIMARRIGAEASALTYELFSERLPEEQVMENARRLETQLDKLKFTGTESDEALGMTWGTVKALKINWADADELKRILSEADTILGKYPQIAEVASTAMIATKALHEKYLKNKVSHEEVEKLFQYVEANYDSASVRNEFFDMLNESEDAPRRRNYMTKSVTFGARQDARYNPIMGSGIPELDVESDILWDLTHPQKPYIRKRPKIGANEPCPCGSGKKFKKCCRGKGIYD